MFARFVTIFAPLTAIFTDSTVMMIIIFLSLFCIICAAFIAENNEN
jgi:hypothetical protein